MFKSYIKIAFRNLARNKVFSAINIFGLALSMAVCLLVILHVKDQLSYDTFHPHADRTYRLLTQVTSKEGNQYKFASTPLPLAGKLLEEFDGIEAAARLYPWKGNAQSGVKDLVLDQAFADGDFFRVFGFTLAAGDPHTALAAPNSIILSGEAAHKFFGTADAMGQVIRLENLGNFRVTGVLNKPAHPSHLIKDAYASMNSVPLLERSGKMAAALQQWSNLTSAYTYLMLKPTATRQQLTRAADAVASELARKSNLAGKESFAFSVQPFNKIILSEEIQFPLGNTGSRGKIAAEILVAFIILLSACFNYTNLSIARSLKRGKEVGIRKVSGALRSQVFAQFIVESLVTAFLSLILAWVLLHIITGQAFTQEITHAGSLTPDISTLLWFTGFTIFAGLLAGTLPAWALSAFKPVAVLKNLATVKLFLGHHFRKSLLVIQFTLSLVATIFTLTFYRQFDHMAHADPGFKREHLIAIPVAPSGQTVLKHAIEQVSGVLHVSAISTLPGKEVTGATRVRTQPGASPINMDYYMADGAVFNTLQLPLLAGTSFPRAADSAQPEQYVVINERAIGPLKLGNPHHAVGKTIWIQDSVPVQVVGVMKDFYHRGLANPYSPLIVRNKPAAFRYLLVSNETALPATFLHTIAHTWKKQFPDQPFEGRWLQQEWMDKNNAGSSIGMLGFLTFITLTIACLGLLGMVSYSTETRRKEIGIRKIMGAGIATIMMLLSRSFLQLLLIAGGITLPIGYALSFFFLNIFANRITVGIDILLISLGGMLAVALLTTVTQIYSVAAANPVNSLRSE